MIFVTHFIILKTLLIKKVVFKTMFIIKLSYMSYSQASICGTPKVDIDKKSTIRELYHMIYTKVN